MRKFSPSISTGPGKPMVGGALLALSLLTWGCTPEAVDPMVDLLAAVEPLIQESGEEIAVFYQDLESGDSLLIAPDLRMHAASTMKVPVMIQLYLDRDAGLFSLEDSLEITTIFTSIVDGSPYSMTSGSDSDSVLYAQIGQRVSYADLIELMIIVSSNLATNILIQEADAQRVTATMRELGADSIQVWRGVEDGPAFRAGLSNTTTARDLGVIMAALGRGQVGSPGSSREMVDVLSRQHWRTKIPAQLPPGTRVAHKTGRITGISHDSGIVFPGDASPFVLVILTRGFEDGEEADAVAAQISRVIFDHHIARLRD